VTRCTSFTQCRCRAAAEPGGGRSRSAHGAYGGTYVGYHGAYYGGAYGYHGGYYGGTAVVTPAYSGWGATGAGAAVGATTAAAATSPSHPQLIDGASGARVSGALHTVYREGNQLTGAAVAGKG